MAQSRQPRSQQRIELLPRPHRKPGPTRGIPARGLSIPKSLPDDVLKVRVQGGMRAQRVAKEKPRARGGA